MRVQAVLFWGVMMAGCQNNASSSKVADDGSAAAAPIAIPTATATATAVGTGYKITVQDSNGTVVYSAPVDTTQDGSIQIQWQGGDSGPVFTTAHPSLLLPTHGFGHGSTAICDQGGVDCRPP